jgi:hypothetical protein
MKLSALETKRLGRLSASAQAAILDLEMRGSRLYAQGNDNARAMANELFRESDRMYIEEVLNRKFN